MTHRQLVFLALTILTAVTSVCDILSDIFIAPRHQTSGGFSSAFQWDLNTTLLLIAWIVLAVQLWRGGRR